MIILDQTHNPSAPKLNIMMLQFVGFAAMVISFGCRWVFMSLQLPGYMQSLEGEIGLLAFYYFELFCGGYVSQ